LPARRGAALLLPQDPQLDQGLCQILEQGWLWH